MRQPTYVNVVRDPTDWYVSQYYFRRYGWQRDANERQTFQGTTEDKERVSTMSHSVSSIECLYLFYIYWYLKVLNILNICI